MRGADIAPGKHQVFHIDGIKGTKRNAVRLGQPPLLQVPAALAGHIEAAGQVIVNLPAAVGNFIVKTRGAFHILLGENIVAYIAAAFAFTGEKPKPFQLPVFRPVVALIFHMIPHAKGDFQQFVAQSFGVVNGVALAAEFNPVKVGVQVAKNRVRLVVHCLIGGVLICPFRWGETHRVIGLPRLNEQ